MTAPQRHAHNDNGPTGDGGMRAIWDLLAEVNDPEVPALTVVDLGIIRSVEAGATPERPKITVTPTYTGCPATDVINMLIRERLRAAGYEPDIEITLSPPWTTDWLSEEGRRKLEDYGIAPPVGSASKRSLLGEDPHVPCPRCKSTDTERISEFGSTACKAHYKCRDCLEPFEYFKCI